MVKETHKVFISYSWSSSKHVEWVMDLAERLFSDGIEVKLDKWDLKEGQDKYEFMEQMVKDETIKKVLMICDKVYMEKANTKIGGVGTESQIISPEVYENTKQEKFIPIVCTVDENRKPYLPTYLKSRIYINLSDESTYEDNYEKLVRNICGKPEFKRPILGSLPSYITDDEPIKSRTMHYAKQIENALLNGKKAVNGLIQDFFDAFMESLEDNRIEINSETNINEFDELVVKNINHMEFLRNDFINVTTVIFKYSDNIDLDKFHSFFEKFSNYSYPPQGMASYYDFQFDNFRFLNREIFLYFIANLIRFEKYKEAGYFINATYLYTAYDRTINDNVSLFSSYIQSLEEMRNKRLYRNERKSVTADLLKQRSTINQIPFKLIYQVEYLLFIVTISKYNGEIPISVYNPRCGVYAMHDKPELLEKIISKRYFEKVKNLFQAKDIDEFKQIINNAIINARNFNYYRYENGIRNIENVIDLDKVATID